MKKIVSVILMLATVLTFGVCVYANDGGSGVAVIAEETKLIKTGLLGQRLNFSDTDFKSALCISDFNSVTIVKAPDKECGTLMLGGRKVNDGQVIRRRNVASLSFVPSSGEVTECKFLFTVDNYGAGAQTECIMKFIEKVNYRPKIDTESTSAALVTTQRDICVWGKMSASDPEGDSIDYMVVVYPKYGTLSKLSDGKFIYTPMGDYTGKDSFTYVARDEWGNYSKATRVNLNVIERMSEVVYVDMTESESYNAAVAMTAMGIMSGDRIGDDMYFNPEATVSRAEFVAMAMKVLGIKKDTTVSETFFDDNDDIPSSLLGYVATAQRLGVINGAFDGKGLYFRPNDPITNYEAAVIVANLIGKTAPEGTSTVSLDMQSIPVWARGEVSVMIELGIFDLKDSTLSNEAISREFAAECLYRLASVKT